MTDFELSTATVDEHAAELSRIAAVVSDAAVAGRTQFGALDFGVLFSWLVPVMNVFIGQVGESVQTHQEDLEQHRSDFLTTTDLALSVDRFGAAGIAGHDQPR